MRQLLLPEPRARIRWIDLPGSTPARVYLHGLGSTAAEFCPTAAHPLLVGRRSLLVDLLGFGFSDRPETFDYTIESHAGVVGQLLDALELTQCEVVGHSMGGAVAVALGRARPDLISRLVLAEPALIGAGRLSGWIATLSENDYVRRGHPLVLARLRNSRDQADLDALPAFEAASPLAVHRSSVGLVLGAEPGLRKAFEDMPVPRACLIGERSRPDPASDGTYASEITVLTVRGAGHMMMNDAPQAFAECVHQAVSSRKVVA
ncbi:alpha/beta fold hydrolase [Streptomyces sp. NPDC001401]|uniref:alpha/beta fold hydrolase n=1 Tax=Streptomyces sp. NPDC001401 TaxID=3364570 RepID=UPI0036A6D2B5